MLEVNGQTGKYKKVNNCKESKKKIKTVEFERK